MDFMSSRFSSLILRTPGLKAKHLPRIESDPNVGPDVLFAGGDLQAGHIAFLNRAHRTFVELAISARLFDSRPAIAVISAGARNPFRHPTPEALGRLEAAGARIYRTDRDGAVLLETDGATVWVTRWAAGTTERFALDPEATLAE